MIKLLNAEYYAATDEEDEAFSCATIQTDIGNFTDYAFVHPEDAATASSYIGCEVAECRAIIQYLKEKIKRLNCELNSLYQLKNDFVKKLYLGLENEALVQLCLRIEQKEKQKAIYKNDIQDIKETTKKHLEERIEFLNKINEKKQDNE